MRAGEMTEAEARQQPCPFGLYDGYCRSAQCRVAWRWMGPKRPRFFVIAPGKDHEEEYNWNPRAHKGHDAYKVRVVIPETTGYCGAIGDPTARPDYAHLDSVE